MPDWPFLSQRELVTIHPWSPEAMGPQLTAHGQIIPSTSRAVTGGGVFLTFPFVLCSALRVAQLWWFNGTSVAGNVDVGIYGVSEPCVKLCSSGATVQAGTSVVQTVDIPDITLGPGSFYLALGQTSGSATFRGLAPYTGNAGIGRFMGASGGTLVNGALPATVTLSGATGGIGNFYLYGLTGKALI